MTSPAHELLERVRTGDHAALNELMSVLYDELHRIAGRHLRAERSGHTLQTTALVHEAYLRLFGGAGREFTGRVHFLAVASRVMRHVLVDYARARATKKRGSSEAGIGERIAWSGELRASEDAGIEPLEIVELNAALDALAVEDESLARLVEMRYFGGMTAEETAGALGLSVHIVRHDLRLAQAWLRRKLSC